MGDQDDKGIGFGKGGEGQPSGEPSGEQQQQTQPEGKKPDQPEFITREEAARLANEAGEQAFRRAQGLYDKGQQKVQEQLAQLEDAWKMQAEAGAPVPDEVKIRMRQKVFESANASGSAPSPEDKGQPPAQGLDQRPSQDGDMDPVTAEAYAMMEEAGITIEDDDPEVEKIDQKTRSSYKFLSSVAEAIEAKRQRLESSRAPTSAGAGGTYNNNPIRDVMDPGAIWEAAKKAGRV